MYPQLIQDFLATERLPNTYGDDALKWFLPYIRELGQELAAVGNRPLLLGINGAQGTGKSTLSSLIVAVLEAQDYRVLSLSIDDFYLGREQRQQLADRIHPLLRTRGVPGTHDTRLLQRSLQRLEQAAEGETVLIPRFDKARDDRHPQSDWQSMVLPVDLVILEGWFVGISAQPAAALQGPVNELEAACDAEGIWRRYVNNILQSEYQPLFRSLDRLVMLLAPSFDQVFHWRSTQEQKLRKKVGYEADGLMDATQLRRFIQHFERLTRHGLDTLPQMADTVFELDTAQRVTARRNGSG